MATLMVRIDDLEPDEAPGVERMLRAIPGVFGAVVSAPEGCAELDIEDDEVCVNAILRRLEREGYTARYAG